MTICVYGNELAAAVGKNPYKQPVDVLLGLWKRYEFGRSMKAAQQRVAVSQKKQVKTLGQRETVIQEAISECQELSSLLSQFEEKLGTEPLPEIIKAAEKQVKKVLAQERKLCKKDATRKQTALGTLTGVNQDSLIQITDQELLKHIQSKLSQSYGNQREPQSIKNLARVKNNNDKFYCSVMGEFKLPWGEVHKYSVGGRIDGLLDNRLIEVKNRKTRFLVPLPVYDLVQVHCYMYLLKKSECDFVENLGDGQEKKTLVLFDEVLWQEVKTELKRFTVIFATLLFKQTWQDRLLQCSTAEQQQAVYFYFSSKIHV